MKNRQNIFLFLSSFGMMLSCLHACSSFVLACLHQDAVPFHKAAAILPAAVIITFIHSQRGWRRIYVHGLHLLGWLLSFYWLYLDYGSLQNPFWNPRWIPECFMIQRTITGWMLLMVILLCVSALWYCGIRLWMRPTDQITLCNRFDLGLALLLSLLLIKLIIVVKDASVPMDHSSTTSFLCFMILGLFSLGLVRKGRPSGMGHITYFKGLGIVLSFAAITFMLGSGLFLLFLPEHQTIAGASSNLLGTMGQPLARGLVFIFRLGFHNRLGEGDTDGPLVGAIGPPGEELGTFHYLFVGVTTAVLLFAVGLLIYHVLKWLFSILKWYLTAKREEREKKGLWEFLLACLIALKGLILILRNILLKIPDNAGTAEKYFKRLLRLGRFSGLPRTATETPKEYGKRLADHFPRIRKQIGQVILLHDEVIYGGLSPEGTRISRARQALRSMNNPLLWFARLKSLLWGQVYP